MSAEPRLQLEDLWLGSESQLFAVLAVSADSGFTTDLHRMIRPLAGSRQVVLTTASSVAMALERIETDSFDLSFLDLDLGEKSLLRWLKGVVARRQPIPVILAATPEHEDLTVRGMVAGAGDYLFKKSLTPELLLRSMHYTLERARLRVELDAAKSAGRRFFDRCPVGGFRIDSEGRLLDCNTAYLEILGHADRGEILGERALQLYYADRDEAGGIGWLVEASPLAERRVCLAGADGGSVWVALRARRVLERGRTPMIEGTLVDLSDLERTRESLQILRKELRELLEVSRDGILWLDPEGRIQVCNRAAESLLGHTAGELEGGDPTEPPLLTLFPPVDPTLECGSGEAGGGQPTEVSFRQKGGNRQRFTLLAGRPDLPMESGTRGSFLVFRPVGSGRESANSRRLETLGRLAGGVVHDFKNQLTSILGYADLLLLDLAPGGRGWENAAELRDAVIRARSLTGELLTLGREEEQVFPRLDLNRALADLARSLERITGPGVTLDLVLGPAPLPLRLSLDHLERIVTNLVANARDARPADHRVRVSASLEEVREAVAVDWGELVPGNYACLVVRDTGTGMDPETRARVFEPFFTTKPAGQGTGLGLSTVADLVARNTGAIAVSSRPGSGTVIRVWLPLAGETRAAESG